LPSAQRGGPYHCRQAQRRQAQGRLGAGHGLPPVPFDGLIGRVGRRSGVPAAIAEMDAVGARMFAEQVAREHHERAMQALRASGASGDASRALYELASLLGRAA
jgi:hypothetical protein